MRNTTDSPRPGFTLIELLIVMFIIGILISLVLVAGADGVRRAEERQTQALIIKLETALSDRLDALLTSTAPINQTHRYLAAITYVNPSGSGHFDPINASVDRRAQVIAQFDYIKAELPDVFYRNGIDGEYPFIFAMPPYPLNATANYPGPNLRDAYALPLGNRVAGLPYTTTTAGTVVPTYVPTPGFDPISGLNDLPTGLSYTPPGLVVTPDSGIYGASFTAAASLTKNLYEAAANDIITDKMNSGQTFTINTKVGYDSADNNNDYYVDNISEVTITPSPASGKTFAQYVSNRLDNHQHKTARAEMLYALLVEGQGPFGSVFAASDFTNRDVADTDGDGMPEFIDAWGQPLQFYRWPIYYGIQTANTASSSDSQQGFQPYNPPTLRRQLDPLDPNQLLTSVAWWNSSNNASFPFVASPAVDLTSAYAGSPASPQANAFMTYFHIIIDPSATATAPNPPQSYASTNWDRTGTSFRRAYYSKFLVLSGGPDKEPGVFQLAKDYQNDVDSTLSPSVHFPTLNPITDAQLVNWCENQAAQVEFTGRTGTFYQTVTGSLGSNTSLYLQTNAGLDDISNHALSAPGTGAK